MSRTGGPGRGLACERERERERVLLGNNAVRDRRCVS